MSASTPVAAGAAASAGSEPAGTHTHRRVRSLVVVCRHGARGITESAARRLRRVFPGPRDELHAVAEWTESEFDHMTDVGHAQMRVLGRATAEHLKGVMPVVHAGIADGSYVPKWRSSAVDRVRHSGVSFWEGFSDAVGLGAKVVVDPRTYRDVEEAEQVFRAWNFNAGYKAAVEALATSTTFQQAALKVRAQLEGVWEAVSGCRIASSPLPDVAPVEVPVVMTAEDGPRAIVDPAAAARAGDDEPEDVHLAEMLFHTTYLKELLDCEAAWPSTSTVIRHVRASRAARALGTSGAAAPSAAVVGANTLEAWPAGVLAAPHCTLLSRLPPSGVSFVRHASRWVWDQRFFGNATTKPFGPSIGGGILREIVGDMSERTPLAVYSAHDYTILSLLSAMRVRKHPTDSLGFGAFLLIECFEEVVERTDGQTGDANADAAGADAGAPMLSVDVRLCCNPFPRTEEGEPLDFVPAMENVIADVSLRGLQHLADSLKVSPAGTTGGPSTYGAVSGL